MNKNQQSEETLIKIITLGSSGVGKTSLLIRLASDSFSENYMASIGIDFSIKRIFANNQPVKLQIWDTVGDELFRNIISKFYYKGTHGIIFAFDITNEQSFKKLQIIYERTINEIKNVNQNISCLLVGCKNDLEDKREITFDIAMSFAQRQGMFYIETSAKLNKNCLEAADYLAKLCLEQITNTKAESESKLIGPQLDCSKKNT